MTLHLTLKSFSKEQYKKVRQQNKKKNAEKKAMNKTITDAVRHARNAIDGALQARYNQVKGWFGLGS